MIPTHSTITHIGAETCVTGSCHLVQVQPEDGGGSINILVDCGIAQGYDPLVPFNRFPVPPADIEYLFLTHAHIDHIGRVPDPPDACDLLILESTYGDRNHENRSDRLANLEKTLDHALPC